MDNIIVKELFSPHLSREVYFILGNGFDIEVGLPTSYPEFLAFIEAVQYYYQGVIDNNTQMKTLFDEYLSVRKSKGKTTDLSKWKNLTLNFWYRHFKKAKIQKGWIDFENEIAYIIKLFEDEVRKTDTVDQIILYSQQSKFYSYIIRPMSDKYETIDPGTTIGGQWNSDITYRQLRDILLQELNELISAFDMYLQDFVEEKEVNPTPAILDLLGKLVGFQECRVLTFNYTSTFDRLIQKAAPELHVEYCHVHGRIGMEGKTGNIVLGIDEKYDAKGEVNVLLAPFKKYYQRVYKETDSCYTDWLRDIQANADNDRELYIFGHSIGITDTDILNSFITSPRMRTTVYSYNDKARADQIANMTEIIGIDEMVRRNSGANKTLVFIQQAQKKK